MSRLIILLLTLLSICLFAYKVLIADQKINVGSNNIIDSDQTRYSLNQVYQTNDIIWGFDFLNPNEIILTEKSGKIKIINLSNNAKKTVTGLPKIALVGQGGLLDICYNHNNQKVYFTYVKQFNSGYTTILHQAEIKNNKLIKSKDLFTALPIVSGGSHFGSRIAYNNDHIFFGIGDRGQRHNAQDLTTHHGKIIRLNYDGSVPQNNPFYNTPEAKPEIWTLGQRNPQGLAFDQNGQLWEAEFGPRGGDEINLIKPGLNYGWPVITYGREYHGPKIGQQEKAGMEQPVTYYTPSISPSGINFYYSDKIPEWNGNLFLANLSSKHLRRLVIKNNKISSEEVLFKDLNERIRQVRMSPDGKLFFSTDSGKLFVVSTFADNKQ